MTSLVESSSNQHRLTPSSAVKLARCLLSNLDSKNTLFHSLPPTGLVKLTALEIVAKLWSVRASTTATGSLVPLSPMHSTPPSTLKRKLSVLVSSKALARTVSRLLRTKRIEMQLKVSLPLPFRMWIELNQLENNKWMCGRSRPIPSATYQHTHTQTYFFFSFFFSFPYIPCLRLCDAIQVCTNHSFLYSPHFVTLLKC